MTEEEFLKELNSLVTDGSIEFSKVTNINHKPHPYCITPKHLKHNDSMCLGDEQIKRMEKKHGCMCGMYTDGNGKWANGRTKSCKIRCNIPYEEHTADRVIVMKLFVKLDRLPFEIPEELMSEVEQLKIDGFVPVDCFSKEK